MVTQTPKEMEENAATVSAIANLLFNAIKTGMMPLVMADSPDLMPIFMSAVATFIASGLVDICHDQQEADTIAENITKGVKAGVKIGFIEKQNGGSGSVN